MTRWIVGLTAALLLAMSASLAVAGEAVVRDANGNKWVIDTATKATPGAGSGEGAVIGAVDDTLASYEKHKFDLQIGLSAAGSAGDDSTGTETAFTSATLYYRPVNFFRFGPKFSWNTVDSDLFSFGLPCSFKLNTNPWSTYNFWLDLNILPTFTVRTDPSGEISRTSAWSYMPSVGFKAEIPMGPWSVEGGLGVGFPFSIEGVTDSAINGAVEQVGFAADVAINVRLGR